MGITETIKQRKSCRTYNQLALKPEDKRELESFISENSLGLGDELINFRIIEDREKSKPMKIDYGMIRGYNTYILGTSRSTPASRVNYGFLMERIVLKATELNIATCWVGYFDSSFFSDVSVEPGYEIPSIVIAGYSDERRTYQDRLIRLSVSASDRYAWDRLFFDYRSGAPLTPESVREYGNSLEMVRLAPSSGNTQPWRVFFDGQASEFHFFRKSVSARYEARGLHDIDIGIALSHFGMVSLECGLTGFWLKHPEEKISQADDLKYIMTWRCE